MKKLFVLIAVLCVLSVLVSTAGAASVSPALNVIAEDFPVTLSALKGETVEFSQKQFSDALDTTGYKEIKVLSLPDKKDGNLYLFDTPVSENQVIPVADIRNLKFVPGKQSSGAAFRFTFDNQYSVECNIVYTDKNNNAPKTEKKMTVKTYSGTVCGGNMSAYDPDGDNVRYEIVNYPEKGNLEYDKNTGAFRYTPDAENDGDSFLFRAVDEKGAYSECAAVSIKIMENTENTVFSDMKGDVRATAAIAMSDKGIMSFSDINGNKTFAPDKDVSRLDFLVAAMNMFGASNIPTVKSTGFADDDNIPAKYKGYVYSASKLGIISGIESGGQTLFCPDRTVTAAEAATILNNVIGYEPQSVTALNPVWASESVCAMNELGIYVPSDIASGMDRADTAQMLYCADCLLYE